MIWTITNMIRSIFFQAHYSTSYWDEALCVATQLLNLVPLRHLPTSSLTSVSFANLLPTLISMSSAVSIIPMCRPPPYINSPLVLFPASFSAMPPITKVFVAFISPWVESSYPGISCLTTLPSHSPTLLHRPCLIPCISVMTSEFFPSRSSARLRWSHFRSRRQHRRHPLPPF